MRRIINNHKNVWKDKLFTKATLIGGFLLLCSMAFNYGAANYASESVSSPVTDLFLSNLPVVNVDLIVVEGAVALILFVAFILVQEPKRLPFVLKSVALFIFVRSIFISLTHLGPFPQHSLVDSERILQAIGIGYPGDLFFSGHTGLPFLFALIFWDHKKLRPIFLSVSIIFAISMLFGHLHYSIDVFAAFFITYGIFHIAQWFFAKDYEYLKTHPNVPEEKLL